MRHFISSIFSIIFFSMFLSASAQSKETCETPEKNPINDLNSISKCTIKKEKNDARKVTLNVVSKKVRKRVIRKRSKVQSIGETESLKQEFSAKSQELEFRNQIVTKNVISSAILFSVVEEVPLFLECKSYNKNKSDCFNEQFSKHFAKNFDPERASDDGINGKVFLQFIIDIKGNIKNLLIKSRNKNQLLESEIKRVVDKLPKLIPGKHKGLPVNVKYSLPINFSE